MPSTCPLEQGGGGAQAVRAFHLVTVQQQGAATQERFIVPTAWPGPGARVRYAGCRHTQGMHLQPQGGTGGGGNGALAGIFVATQEDGGPGLRVLATGPQVGNALHQRMMRRRQGLSDA